MLGYVSEGECEPSVCLSALQYGSQPFPFRTTFVAVGSYCDNFFSPISCSDEIQVLHHYTLLKLEDAQPRSCREDTKQSIQYIFLTHQVYHKVWKNQVL